MLCEEAYAGLYAEWQNVGLAFWDEGAIPVVVFRPVTRLLAAEIAPAFNKPYETQGALARLEAVAAKPWSGKPVRAQYF